MTVSIFHSIWSELTYLLTSGKRSTVFGTKNYIVVELPCEGWLNYIDFSLHFGSCCLLRFCCRFVPKLACHYKPVKKRSVVRRIVRTKFGELKVRLSSIRKRIIVRRTIRSMFGERIVRPVKNWLYGRGALDGHFHIAPELCCIWRKEIGCYRPEVKWQSDTRQILDNVPLVQ